MWLNVVVWLFVFWLRGDWIKEVLWNGWGDNGEEFVFLRIVVWSFIRIFWWVYMCVKMLGIVKNIIDF